MEVMPKSSNHDHEGEETNETTEESNKESMPKEEGEMVLNEGIYFEVNTSDN